MILEFQYTLLPHPYEDEPGSRGEQWAQMCINIIDESGDLLKTVLDIEWDILAFLEWCIENENAILNDKIPVLENGLSVAKAIEDFHAFYRNLGEKAWESDDFDMILEAAGSYYRAHAIDGAFGGSLIKSEALIGKFNDKMTISRYDDEQQWVFEIDVADFFRKINSTYDSFFEVK